MRIERRKQERYGPSNFAGTKYVVVTDAGQEVAEFAWAYEAQDFLLAQPHSNSQKRTGYCRCSVEGHPDERGNLVPVIGPNCLIHGDHKERL